MKRIALVAVLAIALGGCVTGLGSNSARALGARMIADARAQSVMTNLSRGDTAITQHTASGVYCWSLLDPPISRITQADADHIACQNFRAFTTEQGFARRAAPGDTAQAAVDARAAAEIAARPGLARMPPPGEPGSDHLPSAEDTHKPWLYGDLPRDPEVWLLTSDRQTLVHLVARRSHGWIYEARSEMTLGGYREWGGLSLLFIDDLFFPPDLEYTRRRPIAPPE